MTTHFDPAATSRFYDSYGLAEWERLQTTAYGRLQALIHGDFLHRHVRRGMRVLDAGAGPGRFSIELARLGARVTVLDLSPAQLALAREHITAAGLGAQVDAFVDGDITDLSGFGSGRFDAVVCFGGALSYVLERRAQAAAELVRLTRVGGPLLVSVMSRDGAIAGLGRRAARVVLAAPEAWSLWDVLETGDQPPFPSRSSRLPHPSMHLYTSAELKGLFAPTCDILEMAGSNVCTFEGNRAFEDLAAEATAWATVVEIERRLCHAPGLLDSGSHLILAARRR